ncbi:hypothetical protein BT96DRAFT_1024907, partial [Gymnopus androsaceus JB14]
MGKKAAKKCKHEGCEAPGVGGNDHQRRYHTGYNWQKNHKLKHLNDDQCSVFLCPLCDPSDLSHSRLDSLTLIKILDHHDIQDVGSMYPDPHLIEKTRGRPKKVRKGNGTLSEVKGANKKEHDVKIAGKNNAGVEVEVVNACWDTGNASEDNVGEVGSTGEGELWEDRNMSPSLEEGWQIAGPCFNGSVEGVVDDSESHEDDGIDQLSIDQSCSERKDHRRQTSPNEHEDEERPRKGKRGGNSCNVTRGTEYSAVSEESNSEVQELRKGKKRKEREGNTEVEESREKKRRKGGTKVVEETQSEGKIIGAADASLKKKQGEEKQEKVKATFSPELPLDPDGRRYYVFDGVACDHVKKDCTDVIDNSCALLKHFNMFVIPDLKCIALCYFYQGKAKKSVMGMDEILEKFLSAKPGIYPSGLARGAQGKTKWAETIKNHLAENIPGLHSTVSDIQEYIEKHHIVIPEPVPGFDAPQLNVLCPRCKRYFRDNSFQLHFNGKAARSPCNPKGDISPDLPSTVTTSQIGIHPLFTFTQVQLLDQAYYLKVAVAKTWTQPKKLGYELIELTPRDQYRLYQCPNGFPESWYKWLQEEVNLRFTLEPKKQKEKAGLAPALLNYLVATPSLDLVTNAKKGQAQMREEICYKSHLIFGKYLAHAGQKAKEIDVFAEIFKASSGVTWRNFKRTTTYWSYRLSLTCLVTTYLRWRTTTLETQIMLNLPDKVEQAFEPLLIMIEGQNCGTESE